MKNYEILDAVGGIDAQYVEDAIGKKKQASLWVKVLPFAACLCLIVGAAVCLKPDVANPPLVDPGIMLPKDDLENITDGLRGGASVPSSSDPSHEPVITGDGLPVFDNSPVGINDTFLQTISAAVEQCGWNQVSYTLQDEYSFTLHGKIPESSHDMDQKEILKNTRDFLQDSGLGDLLSHAGMEYELEAGADDAVPLSFCYLLCDGERTGAYIRFVFEGSKVLGECQAWIYASECIGHLEKLPLEEALKQAFCVRNHELVPVNASDYNISNEKIVYVNGLPYYSFAGFGINSRSYIDGYALAVDIEASPIRDRLREKYLDFTFE